MMGPGAVNYQLLGFGTMAALFLVSRYPADGPEVKFSD